MRRLPAARAGDRFAGVSPTKPQNSAAAAAGIDRLLADSSRLETLKRRRVGLLTNAACRTADGTPIAHALNHALDSGLARLFAPEHGIAANHRAGQSVADHRDEATGLAVVSLYGARPAPAADDLAAIDILLVDLRDVGVRCYTYAATAAMAAEAALAAGVDVLICDRANPLGPVADGPLLDPVFKSFLAYFDTPFVHGQTLGSLVAGALGHHPGAGRLTVISGESEAPLDEDGWVPPSPALTVPDAVRLYPGLVLFEGTNLSEGRGTSLPFRCIAAPWLDATAAAQAANAWPTGVVATACEIRPGEGDYAGQTLAAVRFKRTGAPCDGLGLGVRLLAWLAAAHPQFGWKTATNGAPMIDTLLGSDSLRRAIDRGQSADEILAMWRG